MKKNSGNAGRSAFSYNPLLFQRSRGRALSRAEKSGLIAAGSTGILAFAVPILVPLPLVFFVLICILAPLFPGFSFFYPVISHGRRDVRQISLTFDDGPDPVATPALLALLARYEFCATFFVNGTKVRRHPELVEAILAAGHEFGNHSYSHDGCIMFRSPSRLAQEMLLTQRCLARHGVHPVFFRPPVGVNVPAYAEALHLSGLKAVNFSCRARDMGNRRVKGLARRILRQIQPGDILLLHDTAPPGAPHNVQLWLAELEQIFHALKKRHLKVVPLGALCSSSCKKNHDDLSEDSIHFLN
ncbi:MAG: polysaccharide deacetylase family protein [Desulfobulbaceae bacterium]|nr:polysaccharide deacetylase family protein [Desulfobulbaceae bacterium]